MLALASFTLFTTFSTLQRARARRTGTGAAQTAFFRTVDRLPRPSIVFVRYAPTHIVHFSLIANEPDLAAAHAWIVYDRGDDNLRLMALAPDRVPYGYDEASHTLIRLRDPAVEATPIAAAR